MPSHVATDSEPELEMEGRARDKRTQQELLTEAQRLYATYVKPLEQEHLGEYVVVSSDGHLVLSASDLDAVDKGIATMGRGHFLFKVGDIAAGKVR